MSDFYLAEFFRDSGGVALAAAIPLVASAVGYGVISGVRYLFSEIERGNEELNYYWEQQAKSLFMEIQSYKAGTIQRHLIVALLVLFLSAPYGTTAPPEFEPDEVKVTGPKLTSNDSILITGSKSDFRGIGTEEIETIWSITMFLKEKEWRISLQKEYWHHEVDFVTEKRLETRRDDSLSFPKIVVPAEYFDTIQRAFSKFLDYYDEAKGKDLGDDRIPMIEIDDLEIWFSPSSAGYHSLIIDYPTLNGHLYPIEYRSGYFREDAKVFLKLLEKRSEISKMRRKIEMKTEMRELEVEKNIKEIFGEQ